MPSLRPVTYVTNAANPVMSRITDLGIRSSPDGEDILYTTTRFDGAVTAWSLANNDLSRIDSAAHGRDEHAGAVASLGFVPMTEGLGLLTGGGATGGLVLRPIEADGEIGTARALGTMGSIQGDLVDPETIILGSGNSVVYGGIAGQSGITRAIFSDEGVLIGALRQTDTATIYAERITALAQARVDGVTYLISASDISAAVTVWVVSPVTGGLTAGGSLNAKSGLWINAPTALETATVAGQTYLILAAAGTGSISIIALGPDGSLTPRAHLLDDLDSRFAGVSAIEVVTHGRLTYVIAGGSDDGISVFMLLPGGQLVAQAHLADGIRTGLADINAIAARSSATGIDIFVASATEPGLTQLRFETGPDGSVLRAGATGGTVIGGNGRDLLHGGSAADRLSGGNGDDILMDGAGTDRLTGGRGQDLFVLGYDRTNDTITDFTFGEDKVNLSAWPMLRSLAQLTLTTTGTGLHISYGDEVLTLESSDGRPISIADLTTAVLIGGTNIPPVPGPGFAGPMRPAPDLPPRDNDNTPPPRPTPIDPVPDSGGNGPATGYVVMRGTTGTDVLRGGDQNNEIRGLSGNDSLYGGDGWDAIRGNAGRDFLAGGTGNDRLWGGGGNDTLKGGSSNDKLSGDAGDDRLDGGVGNDGLKGRGGKDKLLGMEGQDILEGGKGNDRLNGGTGNDRVSGQDGRDTLTGLDGNDLLSGGGGTDKILGGAGNDRLSGGPGDDILIGGRGSDVFVFMDGKDKINDMQANDQIQIDDALWSRTISVDRLIDTYASTVRGEAILDFGDGNRLIIEGVSNLDWLANWIELI